MKPVDVVSDEAYQFSRSLRGVPSPGNRQYRASQNCWNRGLRGKAWGTAFDGDTPVLTDDGGATVKVIKNGVTTFVAASAFSAEKPATAHKQAKQSLAPHRMNAADMAPIQNYEQDC